MDWYVASDAEVRAVLRERLDDVRVIVMQRRAAR
jgi:hypothetical protein